MAHAGIIDIDKLNTALDETEKRKQHEAEMEKQLDEVVQKRYIIRMLGDLPLYHVGFGRLVKGANPENNEPLIKLSDLMNAVAELPTVEAVPVRHGKWKQWDSYGFEDTYKCTACGESFVLIEGTPITNGYKYCPSCGAKMDAERKEE